MFMFHKGRVLLSRHSCCVAMEANHHLPTGNKGPTLSSSSPASAVVPPQKAVRSLFVQPMGQLFPTRFCPTTASKQCDQAITSRSIVRSEHKMCAGPLLTPSFAPEPRLRLYDHFELLLRTEPGGDTLRDLSSGSFVNSPHDPGSAALPASRHNQESHQNALLSPTV